MVWELLAPRVWENKSIELLPKKFSVIVKTQFVLRPSYHRAEAKRFQLKEIILSITLS